MTLADMHREDIKAALRKRFGTVAAFERARKLPEKSVNDVLRGSRSARVEQAVIDAISTPIEGQPEGSGDSIVIERPHRLNAGAK